MWVSRLFSELDASGRLADSYVFFQMQQTIIYLP